MEEDFKQTLKSKGFYITGARLKILDRLSKEEHPLTVEELYKKVNDKKLNLVTVYRALNDFVQAKIVTRIDFDDGHRYQIKQTEGKHHHFIVCRDCKRMVEVSDSCNMKVIEDNIKSRTGFKDIEHQVAFYGVCNKCD